MATSRRMYTFYSTNCRMYTFYNLPIECIHSTSLAIECIHSMTFYILYNIYIICYIYMYISSFFLFCGKCCWNFNGIQYLSCLGIWGFFHTPPPLCLFVFMSNQLVQTSTPTSTNATAQVNLS